MSTGWSSQAVATAPVAPPPTGVVGFEIGIQMEAVQSTTLNITTEAVQGVSITAQEAIEGIQIGTTVETFPIANINTNPFVLSQQITIDESSASHIFRNRDGHLTEDTPTNRKLLEDVANNIDNKLGVDKFGNEWHAKTREDGTQVWTSSRNGRIRNAGVNQEPREWNSETGLSRP